MQEKTVQGHQTGEKGLKTNVIGFVEAATRSFVEELKIGDSMDRATDISPLINEKGREKVERHVGEALHSGARLVTGGERWGERGFFYSPTVLAGAGPSMRVMREETFGPVGAVKVRVLFECTEEEHREFHRLLKKDICSAPRYFASTSRPRLFWQEVDRKH
jgi:Aldehyde dehydrogenase family